MFDCIFFNFVLCFVRYSFILNAISVVHFIYMKILYLSEFVQNTVFSRIFFSPSVWTIHNIHPLYIFVYIPSWYLYVWSVLLLGRSSRDFVWIFNTSKVYTTYTKLRKVLYWICFEIFLKSYLFCNRSFNVSVYYILRENCNLK